MTERPILFSAPMVKAILEERKTQTRRVVKLPLHCKSTGCELSPGELGEREISSLDTLCPYGAPGDRLWVKETFYALQPGDRNVPRFAAIRGHYIYRADYEYRDADRSVITATRKWRPSIFMPKVASRITLEIGSVRIERLREMSNEDAQAEGVKVTLDDHSVNRFADIWDAINGKTHTWASNPWVWVITFRKTN